jgi:hypothetical protein
VNPRKRSFLKNACSITLIAGVVMGLAEFNAQNNDRNYFLHRLTYRMAKVDSLLSNDNKMASETILTGRPSLPTKVYYPVDKSPGVSAYHAYQLPDALKLCDHAVTKNFHAEKISFLSAMTVITMERGLRPDLAPDGIDTAFARETYINQRFLENIEDEPYLPVSEHEDLNERMTTIVTAAHDTVSMLQVTNASTGTYYAEFTSARKDHAPGDLQKQAYNYMTPSEQTELVAPSNTAIMHNELVRAAALIRQNATTHHAFAPGPKPLRLLRGRPRYDQT